MAKAKAAAKGKEAAPKKERKPREKKDSFLKDNYVVINDFNDVITEAMVIRGVGTLVRERSAAGISSVFIPGVKVKTKKDYKYLVLDKGPKSKKSSVESEEDED